MPPSTASGTVANAGSMVSGKDFAFPTDPVTAQADKLA